MAGAYEKGLLARATEFGSDHDLTRLGPTVWGLQSQATDFGSDHPLTRLGPTICSLQYGATDFGAGDVLTRPQKHYRGPFNDSVFRETFV